MDHFSSEDFENSLKYQMGFAKKRALKRGVVPTIYKKQIKNPERIERAHRRENKMIVAELLQRHETSTSYKERMKKLHISPKHNMADGPSTSHESVGYNSFTQKTEDLKRNPSVKKLCD
ncbi:uncharacterized protein LOC118750126 [Rhagoletis pomonella]|uniref:uncharacterized protein LOC118750126 n=1 Tax=Rhagoletis pomonella TaxID=28610 RepID=UPI00177ACA12|nr:uncharacterized protein LOC118750126 [Rhagoletis pomonella]